MRSEWEDVAGDLRVVRRGRRLAVEGGFPGTAVSVSHDDHCTAILLVEAERAGVDLEGATAAPALELAAHYFHPDEAVAIAAVADRAGRLALFLRMWTLKEAHGKMLGEGIGRGALSWKAPVPTTPVGIDGRFVHVGDDHRGYAVTRVRGMCLAVATEPALPAASLRQVRVRDDVNHDCLRRRPPVVG